MFTHLLRRIFADAKVILLNSMLLIFVNMSVSAQTAPPPNMGEETKGVPAIDEMKPVATAEITSKNKIDDRKKTTEKRPILGTATTKETRRESGQVYRLEMEHSAGAKQIIEENDSDGSIENTSTDIDDTPNLPKWKLGSW